MQKRQTQRSDEQTSKEREEKIMPERAYVLFSFPDICPFCGDSEIGDGIYRCGLKFIRQYGGFIRMIDCININRD